MKFKKFLALMLALAISLSTLPLTVFAYTANTVQTNNDTLADDLSDASGVSAYAAIDGEVSSGTTWSDGDTVGDVTISGTNTVITVTGTVSITAPITITGNVTFTGGGYA